MISSTLSQRDVCTKSVDIKKLLNPFFTSSMLIFFFFLSSYYIFICPCVYLSLFKIHMNCTTKSWYSSSFSLSSWDAAAVVDENEDDVEGKNKTVFNLNLPFYSFLFYNDSVLSFSFFYSWFKKIKEAKCISLSFSISFGSSPSLCFSHLQIFSVFFLVQL